MPRTAPFDAHCMRYDTWFERNPLVYQSELLAVRALLPWRGRGLEIGVGTARFAAPLGVHTGLDPSKAMLEVAIKRGVSAVRGVAETLPFRDCVYDYAVAVTTI